MEDALRLDIGGIKCDNKDCDYVNMSVLVEDYQEWLNKPCPKCGENLLTQEDFDNVKMLFEIKESLNKIFPKVYSDEEKVAFSIEMDGTGEINFKEIKGE